MILLLALLIPIALGLFVALSMLYRIIVTTNEVHIVQSARRTISFGKDQSAGNKYYRWPSWVPRYGVKVISLPVSVFQLELKDYAAYDKGRVPFVIDIIAFFRVTDSNTAAQRIPSVAELKTQLTFILKGAIRTILASSEIEAILEGRAQFSEMFTKEVDHQLTEWGIATVKNIELMDIRDAEESEVIHNIMAKKKSLISMQSRTEVAANTQKARTAEIEADRIVGVNQQEAMKAVGVATAEKERDIGIAAQRADQAVKEEARITKEKEMNVQQVSMVREAENVRSAALVSAEREKQVATTVAEGNLNATLRAAEGIEATGRAKGEAEKAMQLAPVSAQVTLATEIGNNAGYQQYLVTIKGIEATRDVGIKQAESLTHADIKIFANSSKPVDGLGGVMDLFTAQGGLRLGAMLEGLRSTSVGEKIVDKVTNGGG